VPNATIEKFGYPGSLLRETPGWVVLLRPQQVTAGCMVLACKESATSLGRISAEAAAQLPGVVKEIEEALAASFRPEKVNYLALMMVDPHVHFHVIPRYPVPVQIADAEVVDPGWPGPPAIQEVADLTDSQLHAIREELRKHWPR